LRQYLLKLANSIDRRGDSAVRKVTMVVHCGKCGAELMGAVNRCWKCGRPVTSRADASSAPPVRRPPLRGALEIPPWEALPALIVDDELPSDSSAVGSEVAPTGAEENSLSTSKRRRSPFAPGVKLRKTSTREAAADDRPSVDPGRRDHSAPLETPKPSSPIARLSALIAICLGAASFALGDYPEVAWGLALVGLGFGITAILSRFSVTSVAGVVFCFAAFLWSGYATAIAVYERTYGVSPWSSPDDDFEPEPLDPNSDNLSR